MNGPEAQALGCDATRELLSAVLDNEASADEQRQAAAHTSACASCRSWEAQARQVHRAWRVSGAEPVPDATPAIMRAIRAEQVERRPSIAPAARIALAVLAASELIGAIPHLVSPASMLGAHAGREQAAFEIALAAGFLYAALRPRMAQGIAVLSTVLAGLLVLTSGVDVVDGSVSVALETHHLVAIVGTVLSWIVTMTVAQAGRADTRSRRTVAVH